MVERHIDEEQVRIGARIAAARREAGLTQREFAAKLGITTRSVQNYESGIVVPYKHVSRIESIARKRPGWVLAGDDRDERLLPTLEALHRAMEQHQELLQDHIEVLRRQTDLLREQREASERRRGQSRET